MKDSRESLGYKSRSAMVSKMARCINYSPHYPSLPGVEGARLAAAQRADSRNPGRMCESCLCKHQIDPV